MSYCLACSSKNIFVKNYYSNNWNICRKCGHSTLLNINKNIDKVNYAKENLATKKIKPRHKFLSKVLMKFKNKSILDIGPGNYLPLQISKKHFIPSKYTGIDMNYNKDIDNLEYLNQINADILDSLTNIKEKFDFIILDNILEHHDRPDLIVEKIYSLMDDNSLLYVSVPNKFNIKNIKNFSNEYKHYSEHLQVFTNKSIIKIFHKNGFKQYSKFAYLSYFSLFIPIFLSFLGIPIFGLYKLFKK